jgi:hypothetical protein
MLSVSRYPPYQLLMEKPVIIKFGIYIMALESISTAYFINFSHQSMCLYVYPPVIARQRRCKNVTTHNYRRISGRGIFYSVRIVSRKVDDYFFPKPLVLFFLTLTPRSTKWRLPLCFPTKILYVFPFSQCIFYVFYFG